MSMLKDSGESEAAEVSWLVLHERIVPLRAFRCKGVQKILVGVSSRSLLCSVRSCQPANQRSAPCIRGR